MPKSLLIPCCCFIVQEISSLKNTIPAFKQEISVFANRNTQKNMQLFDKIHTVFTATLSYIILVLVAHDSSGLQCTRYSPGIFAVS